MFRDDNLIISVSEDLTIGQPITTLTATDLDTIEAITYSLISGDEGKFVLDSNKGILSLRDSLNREARSDYKLVVRADDGEQFTETVINVKVISQKLLANYDKTKVQLQYIFVYFSLCVCATGDGYKWQFASV